MSPLRQQMIMEMQLRNMSSVSIKDYIGHVERFSRHFNCSPTQLGEAEIKQYLHHLLVQRKLSPSYVNSCYCALNFLYEKVLNRPWNKIKIPYPKGPKKLPEILSEQELTKLFDSVSNLKHRMFLMVTYCGGLRISECANLKLTDIDSKRMVIRVEEGKGAKDRYTLLAEALLPQLREYYKRYRPQKYLFEGAKPGKPISVSTIQLVFKRAKEAAGIKKKVSVHTLRHCFATHLLEAGVDVFTIKKLMGHFALQTTMRYARIRHEQQHHVVSPLNQLLVLRHGQ